MMGPKTLREVRKELEAALSETVKVPTETAASSEVMESLTRFLSGPTRVKAASDRDPATTPPIEERSAKRA
jgi:hypothetical protein